VRKKRPRFLDSQSSLYFADDCPEPVLKNDQSPFKETKEQRNFFQGRAFGKKNKIKKKGKERKDFVLRMLFAPVIGTSMRTGGTEESTSTSVLRKTPSF
jgi:hypothetical protein